MLHSSCVRRNALAVVVLPLYVELGVMPEIIQAIEEIDWL